MKVYYRRTNTPSAEQLSKLKKFLVNGKNDITFKVRNENTAVEGQLFYWDYTEKIVISDVDGTVTKSDIGGHVLPRLGISDWAHEGIASLYSNIHKNGYKIVYLSSRAIGLISTTKQYVSGIK